MTLALLLTAATGAWAADTYTVTFKANGNTKTVENVTLPHTFELDPIITELYPSLSGGHGSPAGTSASGNTNVTAYNNNDKHYANISASFEGAVTVTGQFFKDFTNHQYTLEINCMEKLVAISDDKTEASFTMPAYDVTVDYELARDMSVDMTVSVEDAQGKSSIRLKKMENGKYQPADMTPQQMAGLITVTDDIEGEELTNQTDYTVSIFAVDDNDQPTGTAIAFADLTPGRYVAFATAKEGTIYDGQTLPSNIFKLFQGYEVEVDGGEYATYYKDENLKLDESVDGGVLYTISSVSATEAMLSDQINVAPALTPLIVHNSGTEAKTFLLIPTDDQADSGVQNAPEFKGTLTGTTLAASTNDQTNYALNGKAFVWVKYQPLDVPANKCWLEVVNSNARAISILFTGETTGIATATRTEATGDLYDLNGRKVLNPTRKGIYIQNGKKVVIK